MRVDIHGIVLRIAGFLHGIRHRLRASAPVGMRSGDVVSVAGGTVAAHLAVDLCPAGLCVFVFLKDKRDRALTDHESSSALIERQ